MDRRTFVKAVGAASTATMTGLAGCGMLGGGGGGDRDAYDDWVTADSASGGTVSAFTLELGPLQELQSTTTSGDGDGGDEETTTTTQSPSDPLAGITGSYLIGAAFAIGFGVSNVGLSGLTEEGGNAERVHFVSEGIVMEGSFETDNLSTSVEEAGGTEAESYEGYTLYEFAGDGQQQVVTLSDDYVLLVNAGDEVSDPIATTKTLVDAEAGNADRYRDESDDYDALVTALSSGDMNGVQFDEAGGLFESESSEDSSSGSMSGLTSFGALDLEGDALGGAVSADFSEESLDARLAIQYASEDEADSEDALESAIAPNGQDVSVSVDGKTATVEATYEESVSGSGSS